MRPLNHKICLRFSHGCWPKHVGVILAAHVGSLAAYISSLCFVYLEILTLVATKSGFEPTSTLAIRPEANTTNDHEQEGFVQFCFNFSFWLTSILYGHGLKEKGKMA